MVGAYQLVLAGKTLFLIHSPAIRRTCYTELHLHMLMGSATCDSRCNYSVSI